MMFVIWVQGRSVTVKLADTHKDKTVQMQISPAMINLAGIPLATGYPQPGKVHANTLPIGYNYPQNVASYLNSSYASPPAAAAQYPTQPSMSYPPLSVKDPIGISPSTPVGMGKYPFYLGKQ